MLRHWGSFIKEEGGGKVPPGRWGHIVVRPIPKDRWMIFAKQIVISKYQKGLSFLVGVKPLFLI